MKTNSHCKRVFGKTIEHLTYTDVARYFIKPRKENETIEFKSYGPKDSKKPGEHERAVYEGLCAMLNSNGGMIIWGAPEGRKLEGENEKVFVGGLTSVQNDVEPDMLTDRITGRITPVPQNFRHRRLKKGTNQVYVFEVEKSEYGPHQLEGTYFIRLFGQTRKAPNYVVEALMRRVTYPDLRVGLRIREVKLAKSAWGVSFQVGVVNLSPLQNERDIIVSVIVDGGHFEHNSFDTKGTGRLHLANQRMLKICDLPVLHYGHVHVESDSFTLPLNVEDVAVEVAAGGRSSPYKVSRFRLLFKGDGTLDGFRMEKTADNVLYSQFEEDPSVLIGWAGYK